MGALDRRFWLTVGGLAAALIIGLMIGNANGRAVSTTYIPESTPTATVTVTEAPTVAATTANSFDAVASTAPATVQTPAATITDGTWIVGTDIQPGTYRTANDGDGCYWKRLSDTSGTTDSIIANQNAQGPAVVTIASTDVAFLSKRCGTWTRIG